MVVTWQNVRKNSRRTETESCCSASTLLHIFTVWVLFPPPTSVCFLSVSFSSKYLVSVKLTQRYYQRGHEYLYERIVPIIITAAGGTNTDICSLPVYIKRLPASVCVALPGKMGWLGEGNFSQGFRMSTKHSGFPRTGSENRTGAFYPWSWENLHRLL